MEKQAEILIHSIKKAGRCEDSFFTIMTHEPRKISNSYLKDHQIVGYKTDANLKQPWSVCPRWNVTPEADLVISLDSDVIALRDLNPLLDQFQEKRGIFGTIACNDNYSFEKWEELFRLASMKYPQKTYNTLIGRSRSMSSRVSSRAPYYVNNGVVCLSSEYVSEMRANTKKMIGLLNKVSYHDFFITQRATTLAAYACNLPLHVMPKEFNHLEICCGQPNKNTYFFHYNLSKNKKFFDPSVFLFKMI